MITRRNIIKQVSVMSLACSFGSTSQLKAGPERNYLFSLKSDMVADPSAKTFADKLRLLKDLGYDGIEMDSQFKVPVKECVAAVEAVGLPIHGVVNSEHWKVRLSDPDPSVREEAYKHMIAAIKYAKAIGASTVLQLPGAVRDPEKENATQVYQRSQEQIRRALPLLGQLGIRLCIETVWNGMFYDPEGGNDQSPDLLKRYLDEIGHAWVGAYIDLSNFRKYANIPAWLRALGSRVVAVDTKDFRLADDKFVDLGDGDVDWAETRKALADIGYTGWISSEVEGGDRARLADNLARMRKCLLV